MGSFDQSYSSSSPLLVLPPQLPPQPSYNIPSNSNPPSSFTSPFGNVNGNGSNPQAASSMWPVSTSSPPKSTSLLSKAGRKRSRDEAASNLSDDEFFPVQAPSPQLQPENEDEWEYGEGMTLIKPNGRGYIIEAGSQTGTWAEEKAEALAQPPPPTRSLSPERPVLRPSKSQRLGLTSTPSIAEEFMHNGALATPLSSSPERGNGFSEPTIDDFTRHLGIGWSLISNEDHIQAAARGWTKFIENHYPITDAKIALQSRGLSSYLVQANEGYFLFGEDLKQGRLVSTCLQMVWANLRGPTPIFDGEMVMEAGDTPKFNATQPIVNNDAPTAMNTALDQGHDLEVDMDMS
ncbi:Uncharacterized protein BP5553_01314 [Venustampulla echinocandica]|uniref:Uncharacterized protein n=1 Tax=Venustampulla echinocandica TaxID=2656787 RepID=A0A370U0P6_9HELO|nr:Uncharacterized protein BP5553_01314 [Venustampulla echinocandica]RDL41335.1 Uncharacterized protein BP5553_01314 [Venustampulla echinocandica]